LLTRCWRYLPSARCFPHHLPTLGGKRGERCRFPASPHYLCRILTSWFVGSLAVHSPDNVRPAFRRHTAYLQLRAHAWLLRTTRRCLPTYPYRRWACYIVQVRRCRHFAHSMVQCVQTIRTFSVYRASAGRKSPALVWAFHGPSARASGRRPRRCCFADLQRRFPTGFLTARRTTGNAPLLPFPPFTLARTPTCLPHLPLHLKHQHLNRTLDAPATRACSAPAFMQPPSDRPTHMGRDFCLPASSN